MTQRLYPFLYVDDVPAYMDFLTAAFGFARRSYDVDPDDSEHVHAEMTLGDTVVMISHAAGKFGTVSPRTLDRLPAAIYAIVDDVDAHCRRARAAGAVIKTDPADKPWGHRMYTARDREGHEWYFATPQR